ncbi:pseudouridylate synthase [Pseudohalioglobus sediminis]|uniref:tRNA pseudouridine synthase C n=1 Tax=Pseudohalioglobus sediminis TaxID=2606449 RepID=A0A5B0X4Z6_9GAMM|nr:pseudouridine synthase [Pseudohalioglobus sediminis]KAA1193249.1 pseudouridylate synthase [Pseudohalioglobus sediminis]
MTATETSPLPVLYRDEYLVAVNKPSGLLVHRSPIDRHETRFALQTVRDQVGQHVYPVHRLDKPTSGVLLFALDPVTARALSAQFVAHSVAKQYLAVVRGWCPESGSVDHALRDKPDPVADRDRREARPAQSATTHYQCLARAEIPVAVERYPQTRYSLVRLEPVQGRRHQLRRHMKHLGYPIIGDAKYGKGVHNRYFQRAYRCSRLLLHCRRMSVIHPDTGRAMDFQAELDDVFAGVLQALGWSEYEHD